MDALPVYDTFEDAYLAILEHIRTRAPYRNTARGNHSQECLGLSFQLSDPRRRLPFIAARRINPVFHWAEALWYLGGRDDAAMFRYYAPRMAPPPTGDGQTIGGSAHGARIFTPRDGDTISPFDRVLRLLRTEPDSKRGVLPVFAAEELAVADNPDVSCLVALHLLERAGKLHMIAYMRANDCDRGLLADVFTFTVIQEFAAAQLGLKLGSYTHHIGSAHLCDRDRERVTAVLREAAVRTTPPPRFPPQAMPRTTTPKTIVALLEHERALRLNEVRYRPQDIRELGFGRYWQQALLLFEVKRQLTHHPTRPVEAETLHALDAGLAWLTAHRWPRRMPHDLEVER